MQLIKVWFLVALVFLAANRSWAAAQPTAEDNSQWTIDQQVAYIVSGIVSFSRWPESRVPTHGCILGSTAFLPALLDQNSQGYTYTWQHYESPEDLNLSGCDILYLGLLGPGEASKILFETAGTPLLSINENDPECDDGSLICLKPDAAGSSFQVNLDAVARSGIRIHPQVLKLGKELRTAQ